MAKPILLQPTGIAGLFLLSLKTYLRNLPVLLLLGIILLLPAFIILVIGTVLLQMMDNTIGIVFYVLAIIVYFAAFFYFYACVTLAVSLNIVGLKAGVIQILRRIGGKVGVQVLGTGLLQTLIVFSGMILLIIPGYIWAVRYWFAAPIVVLERKAYKSALRRSRELVDGFGWRIFGAIWFLAFGLCAIVLLFAVVLYIPLALLLGSPEKCVLIAVYLAETIAWPVMFLYPVFLYYDLRVRKEAFNVETIREAV